MIVHETGSFSLDDEAFIQKMKLRGPSVEKGLAVGRNIAKHGDPWFVCRECRVDAIEGDRVTVDGLTFHSGFLARVLKGVSRVMVYVVTCGVGMAEHTKEIEDVFDRYMAEGVEHLVLDRAKADLQTHVEAKWGGGKAYHVNPGSLEDWSTLEIATLFDLLEKRPYELGMTLTDSGLMQPGRSVSGFYFESETPFFNCMLCRREHCPNRKAAFDEAMHASFSASV